jgi:hypothetical protein
MGRWRYEADLDNITIYGKGKDWLFFLALYSYYIFANSSFFFAICQMPEKSIDE